MRFEHLPEHLRGANEASISAHMESLLQQLQVGLILRSLFAGGFFVLGYWLSGAEQAFALATDSALPWILAVALLAGFTSYVLHRSILYPFIEWGLNSRCAALMRRCFPLISQRTIALMKELWGYNACTSDLKTAQESAREKADTERAVALRRWADFVHFLYASALCLGLGSLSWGLTTEGDHHLNWVIVAIMIIFFGAGLSSDWRLHSVREHLARKIRAS
jgi:hypothetical protein